MTSEQIANWIRDHLAKNGAWVTLTLTVVNRSSFEIDMPDGVSTAVITVETK
jgi:hypothetical protein